MYKWDIFLEDKVKKIFTEKKIIIDIGGGLRIKKDQGDMYDPKRAKMVEPYLDNVDYKILDPVPDYNPDIVGDIHKLPFGDNSIDAIVCIFILEHVKNPFKAVSEMHRALKPGGQLLVAVPFLCAYYGEAYYKDYWRFTPQGLDELLSDFKEKSRVSIMGPIMVFTFFTPLGKLKFVMAIAHLLDVLFRKTGSDQVYGYLIYLEK